MKKTIICVAIGAVAMYLLDPELGAIRRSMWADKFIGKMPKTGKAISEKASALSDKVSEVATHADEAAADAVDHAADKAKEVVAQADSKIGDAKTAVDNAADKAKDVAGNAADKAKEVTNNAADKAKDATGKAADKTREVTDKIDDKAADAVEKVERTRREKESLDKLRFVEAFFFAPGNATRANNRCLSALPFQRTQTQIMIFSRIPTACRGAFVALTLTGALALNAQARPQWTPAQAGAWHAKDGNQWLRGSNFLPSSAINQIEMWQADTFDEPTMIANWVTRSRSVSIRCAFSCTICPTNKTRKVS